jgi:tRNA pseudouridine38-40 synthase
VEYDGTAFFGLQAQPTGERTVQGEIESAARRLGSESIDFVAAGRTDTGVHALGQVVAISLPERLPIRRVSLSMNAVLPADIRVRQAAECSPDFSPRFDAIRRLYLYRLSARAEPSPLERHMVARTTYRLDPEATTKAASLFVGRWELAAWRSSICQAKRTFLTIEQASAAAPDEDFPHWRIQFAARSFLHHQVRLMVGAIVACGAGRLTTDELAQALGKGLRPAQVMMMPACGLCLARVDFPTDRDPFAAINDPSGDPP